MMYYIKCFVNKVIVVIMVIIGIIFWFEGIYDMWVVKWNNYNKIIKRFFCKKRVYSSLKFLYFSNRKFIYVVKNKDYFFVIFDIFI